ncbi:hypothetical protein [Peribacillus sp. SCS-155]|uniref:hypothetical protein n=1 Tax=Peribacillus sedimenti TaxID=3115297 RepID=UPI0039065EAD
MTRNWSLAFGLTGVGLLVFLAIFGPFLPGIDEDLATRSYYKSFFNLPPLEPSADFWLGTDRQGRDLLSALVMGTRTTLLMAGAVSVLVFLLAIPLGIWSAHSSSVKWMLQGWNNFFSRIPLIFFIIFLVTIPFFVFSAHRPFWMLALLVVLELGKIAEVVQKGVERVHTQTYYEAAIISGTGMAGLFKWHYLPINLQQWISTFFTHIGTVLFLFGQLGIFNIFIAQKLVQLPGAPGGPTMYAITNTANIWPIYLSNILADIKTAPWIPLSAAAMIIFSMISFLALGEGIQKQSMLVRDGLAKSPGLIVNKIRDRIHGRKESRNLNI